MRFYKKCLSREIVSQLLAIGVVASLTSVASAQSQLGTAESDGAITLEQTGGFFQLNFNAKDDKQRPIFQLGYQQRDDLRIEKARQGQRSMYLTDPTNAALNSPLRGISLIGFDIKVRPSGNTASLFSGGQVAVGTQVSVTFGQAYLASSLASFNDLYKTTAQNNLAQRAASISTGSIRILQSDLLALDTSFIPAFERMVEENRHNPRPDPIWKQLLFQARELREKAQKRLDELTAGPPAAPAPVTAQTGAQAVRLDWPESVGATSYTIKRSTNDGQTFVVVASGLTDRSFIDRSLNSAVIFQYVVSAVNEKGTTDSAIISAQPLKAGSSPIPETPVASPPAPGVPEISLVGTGDAEPEKTKRRHLLFGTPSYDAWHVRLSYDSRQDTYYDGTKTFDEQFTAKTFHGYSTQLGYQVDYGGRVPFILGIGAGYARTCNADNLSEVEVNDVTTIPSPTGNTTVRTLSSTRKGLDGDLVATEQGTYNAGLLLYPDLMSASSDPDHPRSSVAFHMFAHGTFKSNSSLLWGGGVYLTQPGNPLKIYGGLNVFSDQSHKLAVSLSAGIPF